MAKLCNILLEVNFFFATNIFILCPVLQQWSALVSAASGKCSLYQGLRLCDLITRCGLLRGDVLSETCICAGGFVGLVHNTSWYFCK